MEENTNKRPAKYYLKMCILLIVALFAISALWSLAFGQQKKPAANTNTEVKTSTALEKPRKLKDRSEHMLQKQDFVVSFNMTTNCPNYVAWHLTEQRARARSVKRKDQFEGDPAIGKDKRIEYYDYNFTRYDRGHMCPSGDNKHNAKAMNDCFLMTNMCPQAHKLNTGVWNDLENECRTWAKYYKGVYVVCGPIFDKKPLRYVGRRKGHRIAVPDRFFKVVLMNGRIPKAIGFIYPNDDTDRPMRSYAVSVDEVEKITGIDFFYLLDDKTENKIEAECNPAAWNI